MMPHHSPHSSLTSSTGSNTGIGSPALLRSSNESVPFSSSSQQQQQQIMFYFYLPNTKKKFHIFSVAPTTNCSEFFKHLHQHPLFKCPDSLLHPLNNEQPIPLSVVYYECDSRNLENLENLEPCFLVFSPNTDSMSRLLHSIPREVWGGPRRLPVIGWSLQNELIKSHSHSHPIPPFPRSPSESKPNNQTTTCPSSSPTLSPSLHPENISHKLLQIQVVSYLKNIIESGSKNSFFTPEWMNSERFENLVSITINRKTYTLKTEFPKIVVERFDLLCNKLRFAMMKDTIPIDSEFFHHNKQETQFNVSVGDESNQEFIKISGFKPRIKTNSFYITSMVILIPHIRCNTKKIENLEPNLDRLLRNTIKAFAERQILVYRNQISQLKSLQCIFMASVDSDSTTCYNFSRSDDLIKIDSCGNMQSFCQEIQNFSSDQIKIVSHTKDHSSQTITIYHPLVHTEQFVEYIQFSHHFGFIHTIVFYLQRFIN